MGHLGVTPCCIASPAPGHLGCCWASPGAGTGGMGLVLVPAGLKHLLALISTAPCWVPDSRDVGSWCSVAKLGSPGSSPELLLQMSWGLLLPFAFCHHTGAHVGLEERGAPAPPPAVPRALKSQCSLHVAETVGIRQSWTAIMFLIPYQRQGYDCTNSSKKLPKAAETSVT